MSILESIDVTCPHCGHVAPRGIVSSVSADRRPDLRDAILDGSFQLWRCDECAEHFRIEPEMIYLDVEHGQWIAVRRAAGIEEWPELEQQARDAWHLAFGERAPAATRSLGASLSARVTFGWPALREKIWCTLHGIDDVDLELVKLLLIRTSAALPLADDVELRLLDEADGMLVFAWVRAQGEIIEEVLEVERGILADVAADAAAFATLRELLTAGTYVDVNRLLVGGES